MSHQQQDTALLLQWHKGINVIYDSLFSTESVFEKLKLICDGVVSTFKVDFCRIWLILPGDLCESGCPHASTTSSRHYCHHRDRCLHLVASSGRYTHCDGKHGRVPYDCYKIGRIASGKENTFLTNDAAHDERVHNHAWVKELGLVSFAGYQLRDFKGRVNGVMGFFADYAISEELHAIMQNLANSTAQIIQTAHQQEKKKAAQEIISKKDENIRAIYQAASNIGFITTDLATDVSTILSFSPGAEVILGFPKDEAIGSKVSIYHRKSDTVHFAEIKEKLRQGKIGFKGEMILLRKNGEQFPAMITIYPLYSLPEEVSGSLAVIIDISDQKRMEEQLLLNEKYITIASLAAGVAHEINTPLSGILQSIQIIEMGLDPKLAQNQKMAAAYGVDLSSVQALFKAQQLDFFLDGAKSSAITAANIIQGLLDFSRPYDGQFSTNNLNELIKKALKLARSDYDLRKKHDILHVTIIEEYDPDLPPVICAGIEIEQVILNLVKNAVQAMAEKENGEYRLTLRTKLIGTVARIEVEDNGPGMVDEVKKQIFNPFYTTKDVGSGTGLGLSASYAIICEKHHGKIWVETIPGKGSKFIVELALNQAKNLSSL